MISSEMKQEVIQQDHSIDMILKNTKRTEDLKDKTNRILSNLKNRIEKKSVLVKFLLKIAVLCIVLFWVHYFFLSNRN